jgi:competence protein ComEC
MGMLCFLGGTATGLFFSWSLGGSLLFSSIVMAALVSWYSTRALSVILVSCIVGGVFSGAWFRAAQEVSRWDNVPAIRATLERAEVVRAVMQKEQSKQATLRPISCGEEACPETLVLASFPTFADIGEGDILSLSCPLEKPERLTPEFDYPKMLAKDGIGYTCRFPKSWKREGVSGGWMRGFLRATKRAVEEGINRAVPEPEAGLLAGLLVGGDDRLPRNIQEEFSRTGLSHIVAVSGYNVSIVAVLLMSLLVFCGLYRQQALWGALLGIGLFTLLVGAPASAVRAAIMTGAALLAVRMGRLGSPANAILLSGTAMLFFNPLLLRYDIGFQLSFAATIGIVSLVPFALLSLRLGDIVSTTLAAEVFVLPILLFHFHTLPVFALLVNAIVLPFVPIAMVLGSVAAFFGAMVPSLAFVFGFPAFLVARGILSTVEFFASQHFATLLISSFGAKSLFASFAIIAGTLLIFRKKIFSHHAPV